MHTIHFLGKILPEIVKVSVSFKHVIKWVDQELDLSMDFICHIVDSKIDIECRLNDYKPAHLVPIYMRVLDLCRAQVDLVAFKDGLGLTVALETFVDPNGVPSPILFKDESLAALCTALNSDESFDQVCTQVIKSVPLFMALRDLVAAISLPHVSPVDCARAMDRLKHLIATPNSKDTQAWQQMRQALQVDEAYLKYITDHSVSPRHGRAVHIPGATTTEIVRRSWTVMNRYFEYLKRGSVPLPTTEFPLLIATHQS